MTTCTYKFKDASGEEVTITGQAEMKAFLANGGLEQLLPGKVLPWRGAEEARKAQVDKEYAGIPVGNRPPAFRYGEGKEPWQMNSAEFSKQRNGNPHFDQPGYRTDGDYLRDTNATHKKVIARAVAEGKPVPDEVLDDYPELAAKAKPAPDKKYSGPRDVSSRNGQMELANRAGTIAVLKGMNAQLRAIDPGEAWADSNIEQSSDLDALRDQISVALVKASRGKQQANPLRKRLEEASGQELKAVFDVMGLAGARMLHGDRVDALMAEDAKAVSDALDSILSAEPPKADPESKPSTITDFGEKIGGARKDAQASATKEWSDDEIASQPFSKVWPAADIDAIEDPFVAAVMFAARAEVPAKPRVAYKVKAWVAKIKMFRDLVARVAGDVGRDRYLEKMKEYGRLDGFRAKVTLLEALDRSQWKRIGAVAEYPDAYAFNDGKKTLTPQVSVEIDGKRERFEGSGSVLDALDKINEKLGVAAEPKKMQFEVRGREGMYSINKKGDKEYRRLKTFTSTKEAFAYMENNYADLVAAWDGVKDRDNVGKADVRNETNRPRTGSDYRDGKDVTPEQFGDAFGFKGVEFGNWVSQGAGGKDRQGMLNQAYDALMDLANIAGIPPKAVSLNGSLGLAFGSRGNGWASAHFEPGKLVINLTKTRGAGTLAHEWFHALDNYFSRQRGGEVRMGRGINAQEAYRTQNYITYRPEPMYVHKTKQSTPVTKAQLDRYHAQAPESGYYNPENWQIDPSHPQGVRPEVERAFADLVETLDNSPMKARSAKNDKGADGYWSRIIERGARSFENYVIHKMRMNGYDNDYLANVRKVDDFARDAGRYPYLLDEEVAPVAEAFDALFSEIKTKETEQGVALYEIDENGDPSPEEAEAVQRGLEGKNPIEAAAWLAENAPLKFAVIAEKVRDKLQSLSDAGVRLGMAIIRAGDIGESALIGARGVTSPSFANGRQSISVAINGADMKGRVGTSYRTALHELVHAATLQPLDQGRKGHEKYAEAYRDLDDVGYAVVAHLNERIKTPESLTEFERALSLGRANFLDSPFEVIAWALSSHDAQAYLESIPYKSKSLWTAFVEAVRKVLGLKPGADTALSEVLRISDILLKPEREGWPGRVPLPGDSHYEIQQPGGGRIFKNPGGRPETNWADAPAVLRDTSALRDGESIPRDQAEAFIRSFVAEFPGAPPIMLADSFSQLPKDLQADAISQGSNARRAKGALKAGKAFVVLNNHHSMADLEATVFHEILGHTGIRKLLGPQFSQELNKLFIGLGGYSGLERIMEARGMGQQFEGYFRGIQKARASNPDAWTDALAKSILTEEVFAHIAEQRNAKQLRDRFMALVGMVRDWLRRHGFMDLASLGESDIVFMLQHAREGLRDGSGIVRNGVRIAGGEVLAENGQVISVEGDRDFDALKVLAGRLGLTVNDGPTVFSFAGESSRASSKRSLKAAKARIDSGENKNSVREDTGWFVGADDRWRFEINDRDAALKTEALKKLRVAKHGSSYALSTIMDHPKLYAAYPFLRQVRVFDTDFSEIGGSFDGESGHIQVNLDFSDANILSFLMHEIQHAIQNYEGFASGTSGVTDSANYRRSAGEVEARNVQSRISMTDAERRATPPSATADVAGSDVIVVFNGKEMQNAPIPANAVPSDSLPESQKSGDDARMDDANNVAGKQAPNPAGDVEQGGAIIQNKDDPVGLKQFSKEMLEKYGAPWLPKATSEEGSEYERLRSAHYLAVLASRGENPNEDAEDDSQRLRLYHGSPETDLNEIRDDGKFRGLFMSPNKQNATGLASSSSEQHLHVSELDKKLVAKHGDLNNLSARKRAVARKVVSDLISKKATPKEVTIVLDAALDDKEFVSDLSTDEKEVVTRVTASLDDGDASWEVQMIRGQIAKALGYKAVAMRDEQGTSYLVLPGVDIQPLNEQSTSAGSDVAVFRTDTSPSGKAADGAILRTINTAGGRKAVRGHLADAFSNVTGESARTLNWWQRTIGSQYGKARSDKDFGRVYDAAHAFLDGVSAFAKEASERASGILPHLDTWRDVSAGLNVKKQWADSQDYQAIAPAIFDGTLANGTTGKVWTDEQLRDKYNLNDKQIGHYREFRAAVDFSLETLAASEMARMARASKMDAADRDMGMDDALSFYLKQLDPRIKAARDAVEGKGGEIVDRHTEERAALEEAAAYLTEGAADLLRNEMQSRHDKEIDEVMGAERSLENLRASFTEKVEQIRKLQSEGYAPLMRFGQYTVDVARLDDEGHPLLDEDGNPDRPFFGMFESESEARKAEKILTEEYPGYSVTRGVLSTEANQLYRGLTPETAEMFARLLGTDENEAFQAYLKQAVANRSAMKRLINRMGIEGFATDVPRVLSAFITSNARLSSGNWYFGEMSKAVEAIPKHKGDVKTDAVKLMQYVQNPVEEAAGLRGFLFFSFLGGSVASAVVNLTQTFTTTLPYLSQFGVGDVAKALPKAMALSGRMMKKGLDAVSDKDLKDALRKASDEGVVDPQEIHLLMAEAGGNGASVGLSGLAGAINKEWATPAARVTRSLTQAWGMLFGAAEKYNRHVAFIAAWDVAPEGVDRYEFAKNAVTETQFDYTKASRPNWARGAVGATLFTFKTFSINYVEFMSRLPPRERAIALVVLFLLAGMSGMPGADDLDDVVDTVAQKMGYNWNNAAARHAWLVRTLGTGGADFVERGVSSAIPLDVSARLGMGNLVPGTGVLQKSNTSPVRDVQEFFGPAGSVVAGFRDVFDNAGSGKGVIDTALPLMPKMFKDLRQAVDMVQTGQYRDMKGRKVVDVDGVDAVIKGIGFQPNSAASPRRVERMLAQSAGMQRVIRQDISELWARGVAEQDAEKVASARTILREWNEKNPESKITMNPTSIAQRVRAMRLTSADRLVKATPKDMRGALAAEMAVQQ